tara:strand:- start:299 stop:1099 length:801 start_codon:yes stop_codon:yes gene_type:complete
MSTKKIKKHINTMGLNPNKGYKYNDTGDYFITDKNGKFLRFASENEAKNYGKSLEEEAFEKALKKEETKTIENKVKRNKEVEKYKSSSEIQREKYDSSMDEYFKIDAKLQKEIDAIVNKKDAAGIPENQNMDVADIISNNPRLKNLQKNKIKAMKKAWALSQSGDEDFREEALDAFGALPKQDFGKFTPSASPGVREYSDAKEKREQQIDTSMDKEEMMRKNMDVQPGSFSTPPRTREEVARTIPSQMPKKKKYTDEELLRIISGK